MDAYKVRVKTTNALGDMTCDYWGDEAGKANYYDCAKGILYVITDDPQKIYKKFSKETVISIVRIGIGCVLQATP